jgi:beta-lactamase superfamily II metal-dependent hydrolase
MPLTAYGRCDAAAGETVFDHCAPCHPRRLPRITSIAVFLCLALLAFGYAAPATAGEQVNGDYFHTGAGARYLERAKGDIVTVPLRGDINVLMGSGGNIIVLSGSEGKFLVDAGIKPSKDKLQAALNKIGPSPLKYVVNTHWHWDHTDGNEWMHAAGASIIAQRNTPRELEYTQLTREPENRRDR